MKISLTRALSACTLAVPLFFTSACSMMGMQGDGPTYVVTIKNDLKSERLAPVLIVGDADDSKIWIGRYVSPEAHTQFTTGNPSALASQLGGEQLLPGRVGVNGELSFTFRTKAKTARITAMVHPDITPDNYVTAKLDLSKLGTIPLDRFDIGDDEKRMTVERVGQVGTVKLSLP